MKLTDALSRLDCPAGPQDIGRTLATRGAGSKGKPTRRDAADYAASSYLSAYDQVKDEGGSYASRYKGRTIAIFEPERDAQGWFVDDIWTCTQYLKD